MPRTVALVCLLVASTQAFFFGGGSSGGCGCSQPACPPLPPPPVCAPPPPPACAPISPCGGSYPVPIAAATPVFAPQPSYAQAPIAAPPAPIAPYPPAGGYARSPVQKRDTEDSQFDEAIERTSRVKKDAEQAFDPKCNSEALKNIIIKNIHENTAMAKRQIQTAAANEIGGRIDVICSKGTFSYIVNTEIYCETAVDGTTCFAFRQSS